MQEIICVLDTSGSMQSVADDAVGGYNDFLDQQQEIGEANLTVINFATGFDVKYEGKLSKADHIDHWPAFGMTALFDAIGKTFEHVKERFTAEEPETVILAIMTDGHENSSKEFTTEAVKALITEHEEKYGWNVIFLAADQDAWATAQLLGVQKKNAINYASADTRGGTYAYSNAVASYRS